MRRVYFHEIEAMNLAQVEETACEIWKQSRECDCDDWGGLLDACLSRRQYLHNNAFQLTDAEFERFKVVAAMFTEKTEAVLRSARRMYTQLHEQMKNGDWSVFNSFEVEASIRVAYEDDSSVFILPGDSTFDFCEFAEILAKREQDGNYDGILRGVEWPLYKFLSYDADRTPEDDIFDSFEPRFAWRQWLVQKLPRLLEVPIGHGIHQLFELTKYSLPDIIRINSLACEVKVAWQNDDDND